MDELAIPFGRILLRGEYCTRLLQTLYSAIKTLRKVGFQSLKKMLWRDITGS